MKNKYNNYADMLEKVGDAIIETGKWFDPSECFVNPKKVLNNCKHGVERYKECLKLLKSIKAPEMITVEHSQLVDEIENFVNSKDYIFNDLLENGDIQKNLNNCLRLSNITTDNILIICENICKKLGV